MTREEAKKLAHEQRSLGKTPEEALAAFEGTGCDWLMLAWALQNAYGLTLLRFREIFDARYESLDPFETRR
jgi:hypothetical protein